MIEQSDPGARTMSRRQALKRGAVVGGALVWTVPAVQAINMTQAEAASAPRPGNGNGKGPGKGHGPGGAPPQAGGPPAGSQDKGLAITGAPVIATAAAGTGLLVTGATVAVVAAKSAATTAIAGAAAAGAAGAGGAGAAGAAATAGGAGAAGGAAPSVIQPPPAK